MGWHPSSSHYNKKWPPPKLAKRGAIIGAVLLGAMGAGVWSYLSQLAATNNRECRLSPSQKQIFLSLSARGQSLLKHSSCEDLQETLSRLEFAKPENRESILEAEWGGSRREVTGRSIAPSILEWWHERALESRREKDPQFLKDTGEKCMRFFTSREAQAWNDVGELSRRQMSTANCQSLTSTLDSYASADEYRASNDRRSNESGTDTGDCLEGRLRDHDLLENDVYESLSFAHRLGISAMSCPAQLAMLRYLAEFPKDRRDEELDRYVESRLHHN